MRVVFRSTVGFATALLVFAYCGVAQPSGDLPRTSLRIQGGYGWSVGKWAQHRYAGVSQFGGGFGFRAELESRPYSNVGFALGGGYMKLSTAEWESFARSRGDAVNTSAYLAHGDWFVKVYLTTTLPHIFKLALGITLVNKQGHESFRQYSYEYDFLKGWDFGFAGGIEYEKYFTDNWAVGVRIGGMFVHNGVSYGDGEKLLLVMLPVTAGFSFSF